VRVVIRVSSGERGRRISGCLGIFELDFGRVRGGSECVVVFVMCSELESLNCVEYVCFRVVKGGLLIGGGWYFPLCCVKCARLGGDRA